MSGPIILVYSHRPSVREEIIGAIGRRPVRDLPRVTYLECSSVADVLTAIDAGGVDLAILDGEAQPTGGMGISRQIHNEAQNPPRVILAVRRAADRWLATGRKRKRCCLPAGSGDVGRHGGQGAAPVAGVG